jgi:hypothetical protein
VQVFAAKHARMPAIALPRFENFPENAFMIPAM